MSQAPALVSHPQLVGEEPFRFRDPSERNSAQPREAAGRKEERDKGALATAILIALTVVLILAVAMFGGDRGRGSSVSAGAPQRDWDYWQSPKPGDPTPPSIYPAGWRGGADAPWRIGPGLSTSSAVSQVSPDAAFLGDPLGRGFASVPRDEPQRHSVYAALGRLYSTADVDPLITGSLYEFSDGVRDVYAERTSHGDVRGLTEYSSSGGAGDVGVDVGPFGLDEYGGRAAGFDDGIPEPWSLPSTPVRWYAPRQRDYYGPEGPTVYSDGLYSPWVPDHDPLMN